VHCNNGEKKDGKTGVIFVEKKAEKKTRSTVFVTPREEETAQTPISLCFAKRGTTSHPEDAFSEEKNGRQQKRGETSLRPVALRNPAGKIRWVRPRRNMKKKVKRGRGRRQGGAGCR